MGLHKPTALLIQLEFPTWKLARPWTYSANFAIQDALSQLGVECCTIPAIPGESRSWLSHARSLLHNKKFDQVWVWLVHYHYDEPLLDWLSTIAPVRIGVLMESLHYGAEAYANSPSLLERPHIVDRQIQALTHVLTFDEQDADEINATKSADAIWWPGSVPRQCIVETPAPSSGLKSSFSGSLYGSRRLWLEHPAIKDRIVSSTKSTSESEFPALFDELQQYARDTLASKRTVSEQDLVTYISNLHRIRQGEFFEWIRTLRTSGPTINLPSYASFYGGRVFEGMAAGTPVLSFDIANRPKTRALFEDGQDILLFSQDDPSSLVRQLDRLEHDCVFSEKVAVNALQKIRTFHTIERRVRQTLDWVQKGKMPDYEESSLYGTFSDSSGITSITDTTKELYMTSDSQERQNVNTCLPQGYMVRVGHEQYLDTPGEFIYQPHVYELAGFLAERSGAKWIIDIGCGSGEKLQALSQQFRILGVDCSDSLNLARERLPQGTFIDCDLENGLPAVSDEILGNAVVICSDVIEHLQRPACLMEALAGLSKIVQFLLISTPDRDRARGWIDNGPPANPAHVMEWAATEFARFMKEVGFEEGYFLGHTVNTDFHLAKTTLLALAGTQAMPPFSAQETFRVAAIIHVYNEADILPEVINHLYKEGVEVHIFDNWSKDGSWEIICSLKELGKVTFAERFPESRIDEYQWKRQLEKTAAYAATLPVDWVMHHDADEIRISPWRDLTLKNALAHIHGLGYNAVDHTVIDFRFLSDRQSGKGPYEKSLTHFEFGRRPGHFHQVKSWKNISNVQLSNTGGHEAEFSERRIYPIKFLIKHYPLRNFDQAKQKVFRDRLPRVLQEHKTLGWHSQYDQYSKEEITGWLPKDLLPYHSAYFDTEYLVERISGIGLEEKKDERMKEQRPMVGAASLKNYTRDESSNVWQRPAYAGIAYSDGNEIEDRLRNIITQARDVSVMSVELAGHYSDWPSRYHLSNQRANLLRPFEEDIQGKQVLEVGAGCGAITRYLGEIGAEVVALEGSLRRASIAALRCRDLENVTVVAEAVHTFECAQKFDVVTLIGVLEYARKFFPGEGKDPVDAMLSYVSEFLNPGGKLIIAIENQLGLKYFAGFLEDHVGEPMFGIEEQYGPHSVVTFGRKDLGDRVGKAGLPWKQWWYPFPDYKLPRLMLSEQGALPIDDMNLFPLVRNACSKDLQVPSQLSFNQERAWRPVMRNGLLGDMANSFVLVASNREIPDMLAKPLAIHYATDRRPEFAKKVIFTRTEHNVPMTHQIALYPQSISEKQNAITHHLNHQVFVQGQLWQDCLIDILTSPVCSFEQIQQWFQVWLKAFYLSAGLEHSSDLMYKKISGKYIDMIPQNLIVDQDGTWQFIDQEWEYLHEVQVGYIVYRALVTSLGAMKNLSKHLQEMNTHLSPLILKVAESVGFSFSTQHLKQCMLFEMLFQHYVQGKVHSLLYEDLSFPTNREVRGDLSQTNLGKSNSHSFDFECSVIIPVFNKVELTQQCLFQLAKETDGVSYEVIVVNNNSTDGTNEFLGTIGGDVKIIHNNANLGFAKSCNQGAQAARGKYLVFLNNDTIPQSGWLRALVNEADSHQDVAVVGGKLLYTNDTVQHAGIIFNRKTGLPGHWANGVKSDSPLVNQRKQFKAVTAACMLIKRTAFEQVKGFDEAYVNGYEDVDLCLKIDREGQKIIYQPQCSLYHLESQTDGRQDHMEQNRDLFLSRWGNMWLEDQDIVAYEEGCAMVQATLGQEEGIRIIPMANDVERRQWESVMKVQKMLHGSTREALTQGQRKDQLHKVLREHEHWPMDSGVLDWGGYVCEILGFEDHAREFWCKLLTIGENLDARRSLTRVAIKHGQLEDAQMHLDKLKKNGSLSIEDTILQGTLFIQRQEYDKATVLFEDALAQEPKQRKICLGLGMAQLGQGNATNALDVFLAILKEYPDDEDAVHWVVRSGSEIKDWARIAVQLEHFLTRNPANCDIRFTLAGVYLQGGMRDKSRKEYETLRLLKPDYEGLDDIEQILSVSSLCHTTVPNDERIADVGLGIPASSQSLSDSSLTEKRVSVLVSDTICGAVRLVTPLLACIQRLGIEGKVFNSLENDNIKNTLSTGSEEVWLSQRTNTIDKETLRNAQAQGTRIVHDIDDLIWKVPDDNPNVSFVKARSLRIRKFLPFVDCVTVSTDPIRDFLTNWGIESTVLPNCLFPKDWIGLTPQSRVHRRPRVGWAGQVRVHQTDLGLLYHVMEILGDEVEWVFLGDAPERLRNSGMRMEIYPMADMNEYPQALANLDLDIALAPLVQNEFNEAKSDIRILQYGILGYPVIATDIYPHRHAPITRVSNDTDAWVRTIRERIHDLEATKVEGENLRQWVLDNRMIDHYLPQYQTAWFGLSASSPEITVTPSDGSEEVLQCIKKNECQFTTDCSIIIPVFNKAELTKQCLVELNKVTDGVSYQVIVVDNNSTDETQDILEGVKGDIHVIRNVENLGFAKACNQGAKVAHGKYLIFLNNDTIPQSGWLSTLVEEAESEHDIAIVGSKLLYPNGTIQHAGVAISRSLLMPYHIYSGLPSDDTFGNRRREFQAVTAACMLVKRKWFDAAGGFDESYRNGFEDADLCLNIRERGGRIVYQPKSWLYHLESQSPGRKLHNDHNAVLFIERWGSKHLADEDSIAFQDGMALLVNEQEDSSSVTYKRLIDEQESGSWSKVSRLQQLLLQHTGEAIVPNQTNSLTQEILQLFRCQDEMPKDVPVLEWIALRCYFLGLQDLAENYFRRALQEGESAKSRAMLARFELNRGNLSAARMHLMPLLEIKPNDGFVLHLYGVYLMQCEKFLEAGEAFHKAIEHDGDRKKSQLGIGMAHVGMGQTREAWDVFIEAAHENPDDVETMNWVIRMGTELMNWETLSQVLSRFLERNPTSVDMRFALAGVCVRQGNLNEAQMQCNTLKVLQPNFDGLIDLQKAISQDGQNSISLAS